METEGAQTIQEAVWKTGGNVYVTKERYVGTHIVLYCTSTPRNEATGAGHGFQGHDCLALRTQHGMNPFPPWDFLSEHEHYRLTGASAWGLASCYM